MTNIVLGEYKNDKLVYKGHVTLGVGGKPLWRDQQNGQILDTPTRVKSPSVAYCIRGDLYGKIGRAHV